ncbi:hypothetical protein CSC17_5389 [Klebsiella oxytoca]|nr:hypothetical protein CSC17_5389 [Klebsiella oxytoca]
MCFLCFLKGRKENAIFLKSQSGAKFETKNLDKKACVDTYRAVE